MSTLQAFLGRRAHSATRARDRGQLWGKALNALGIALVFALLLAGFALRALMYVRLP